MRTRSSGSWPRPSSASPSSTPLFIHSSHRQRRACWPRAKPSAGSTSAAALCCAAPESGPCSHAAPPDVNTPCALLVMLASFTLNEQEYFERPGISVMLGQDYYPEGHQGGLSIIMHDERIASNGDLRLEPAPGQWSPIPKPGKREVDRAQQQIRVQLAYPDADRDRKGFNPIIYPDLQLAYTVRA